MADGCLARNRMLQCQGPAPLGATACAGNSKLANVSKHLAMARQQPFILPHLRRLRDAPILPAWIVAVSTSRPGVM